MVTPRPAAAGRFRPTPCALALALAALAAPAPARAGHAEHPDIDYLAESLDQWDFRLSFVRFDVGVYENVQLGTYTLPWLLAARNAYARWTFYQSDRWAFATQLGFLTFNPKNLNDKIEADIDLRVIPFKLQGTWTWRPDVRFTAGLGYAQTITDYEPPPADTQSQALADFEASLGVSTARLELGTEWRVSNRTALIAESQIMLFQKGGVGGSQTIQVDDRTTVQLHERGSATDNGGFKGNIGGAVQWAWDTFHLKAGLYFGDYVVPLAGMFVPAPFIPEFDMSWRW